MTAYEFFLHKFAKTYIDMKTKTKAILLSVLCMAVFACSPQDRYIAITGYAQGGTYSVKLNLRGQDGIIASRPEAVKAGIDSVLEAVNNSVSGYNKGSLLSRFNAGEKIVPDDIFRNIWRIV